MSYVDKELERLASTAHDAYLKACDKLGFPVKPEYQLPYAALDERAKEIDRMVVEAVRKQLRGGCMR